MFVVASDYDGTLRTGEFVDKKDVEMIRVFRKQGNLFGIVTGRSMESIKTEIEINQIEFDFIVANNGGVIYDRDFKKLQCLTMDLIKAAEIIDYIKGIDCVSYVINDGYHRYKFTRNREEIDRKYGTMEDATQQEENAMKKGQIAQLVISLNDQDLAHRIAKYIQEHFVGYAHAYVNVNCVDIVPEGVSKAQGLLYIEKEMKLDHDHIYAIGDSFNDLPMIEAFHGCAMSHAQDIISKSAEAIYESVGACIQDVMEHKN